MEPLFANMTGEFTFWLKHHRIETCTDKILQKFEELGATELSDLFDLEEEDILSFRPPFLKKLEFVRFKRALISYKTSSAANKSISPKVDLPVHKPPPLPSSCPENGCTGMCLSVLGKRRNNHLIGLKGPDCRWFISCTKCNTRWHACHFLCGHLAKISSIGSSDIIRHEKGRFNKWQKQIKFPCTKNPEYARLKLRYMMAQRNQTLSDGININAGVQNGENFIEEGNEGDTSRLEVISKREIVTPNGKISEGDLQSNIDTKLNQEATKDSCIETLQSNNIEATEPGTRESPIVSNGVLPAKEIISSNESCNIARSMLMLSKQAETKFDTRKISDEDNVNSSSKPVQSNITQYMPSQKVDENIFNEISLQSRKSEMNMTNEANSSSIQEGVEDGTDVDNILSVNTTCDSSHTAGKLVVGSRLVEETQPSYAMNNICSQIERIILAEFEAGTNNDNNPLHNH